MRPTITHLQNAACMLYQHTESLWKVLVKQDGNEDHYLATVTIDWEDSTIFSVFPLEATGVDTALLDIRLAAQAQAPGTPNVPTSSIQCSLPAVVQIEPAQHCILVELRCAVYSVDEPPVVLVPPDPALAFRFLQPEGDPFKDLYVPGEREALIEKW